MTTSALPATSGATERDERICQAIAAFVSLGFALAACWELADGFAAGHFASASAVCTSAENMWRWGVLGPVPHQLVRAPVASDYYCHHPWGIFWVSAPFMKLFGHHAFACRLPALLQSSLTPPALYFAARALWGPIPGAVAASSFAVLPIALGFSNFNSLEVPVMFGTALAIWGHARFCASGSRRFAALSLLGLSYALCCDWAAVVFAAGFLAIVFMGALRERPESAKVARGPLLVLFAAGAACCVLIVGGHLWLFRHLGQLRELFAQGNLRSTGVHMPLSLVLEARKFWIEVSFTGLAIAVGKLALPVLGVRVLLRRSALEALPLAVFAMAAVQYVVFKQGADIHIFWPHYFALYFALASAGLVQSGLEGSHWAAARYPEFSWVPARSLCVTLGFGVPLAILPDGLRALGYAHRSGGRFNENGHLIKPDEDKVAALEWWRATLPANARVALHPGMRQSLWVDWSLERPVRTTGQLPLSVARTDDQDRFYAADQRFMSAAEQDALAANFTLTPIGPFLALDRAATRSAPSAFSVAREEPTVFEAYFVSSSHAQRRVVPDAYLTWEVRDRFGIGPNPPPNVAPETFEERRIAHNIAVARSDDASRQHWLAALLEGCDVHAQRALGAGQELLGTRLERGASLVFSVYFRAAAADASEPMWLMHSTVLEAPWASLVPRDEVVAAVGMPFAIPVSRWKPGYVYSSVTEVIRRLGRERWTGAFRPTRGGATFEPLPEFEVVRLE